MLEVLGTAPSPRPDDGDALKVIAELSRRAERHGVNGLLAFYNHRYLDPWAVAGAIMQSTATVSPLAALQPYALPPFTAAKLIHGMTRLYGRRVDINLITGAASEELGQLGDSLDHDQRYERATEYAKVLRALLSVDEPLHHEGRFYHYRGLRAHSWLPPEDRPRVFVAGSSPASRRAAEEVGDIAITHPEPVDQFAQTFLDGSRTVRIGIRVGLIVRDTDEQAWRVAHDRYQSDRRTRLKTAMRRKSDSDWSRRMATLSADVHDDVYWTGAYQADKGSMPLLVGSHDRVADYLDRYLALGVDTLLLGDLPTEEDFRHAGAVLADVRGRIKL
ncbi:LLM class flavin-dependent oxidoreductase [Kutzneria sp. NPDC052558]|uniref:LLM class flavin-dependent oxidoreductase n=1 Tax=Kutzneria sp. NPDC052558 TaxID=3364121 RepID=UPI0037C72DBB